MFFPVSMVTMVMYVCLCCHADYTVSVTMVINDIHPFCFGVVVYIDFTTVITDVCLSLLPW